MWERLEARAAAGELVAGTEDRLEVGSLSSAVSFLVPPPLSEARSWVLESRRALRGPGGGSGSLGEEKGQSCRGRGEGQRAAEAGGGGGVLLLTAFEE